jgi:hypothetical protein
VVSSHSAACGASSFFTKARIDSRSWSCSSVKMKCLRLVSKSGLSTFSAVAIAAPPVVNAGGPVRDAHATKVGSGTSYFWLGSVG